MNTYKNEILSTFSIACLTLLMLFLPSKISLMLFLVSVLTYSIYVATKKYTIDYKYCFSFVGQLCTLILVSFSFVAGLSFIANGMA